MKQLSFINSSIIVRIIFIALLLVITITFFYEAKIEAEIKDFWVDEEFGLENCRKQTYLNHILIGARGQASPSPLFYITLKFLDQIKKPVNSFGLSPTIYYRLHAISFSAIAGFCVILFLLLKLPYSNKFINIMQYIILLLALVSFLKPFYNFYYSIETRPYSLWNATWFAAMLLFLYYQDIKKPVFISLIILALSATASVYQITILALSYIIYSLLKREKILKLFKKSIKYFLVPLVIALYYILIKRIHFGYGEEELYVNKFYEWWLTKKIIPVLSFLGIIMASCTKNYKRHMIPFLTMLILFSISPLLNKITMSYGMFFSHRQYLYYDIIYPMVLTHLALAFPDYMQLIKESFKNFKNVNPKGLIKLLLVLILCFYAGLILAKGYDRYKYFKLNFYMPKSYDYLVEVKNRGVNQEDINLKRYLFYFKTASKIMPGKASLKGLLGFCYYYLGEEDRAVSSYKKAIDINPEFFWYYYNLGFIYYENKDYIKAIEYFKKSIAVNPKKTVTYLVSSRKVYLPIILPNIKKEERYVNKQLKEGYRSAFILLISSYQNLKKYNEAILFAKKAIVLNMGKESVFSEYIKLALASKNIMNKDKFNGIMLDNKLKNINKKNKLLSVQLY